MAGGTYGIDHRIMTPARRQRRGQGPPSRNRDRDEQSDSATGHRGWKRHPGGIADPSGTSREISIVDCSRAATFGTAAVSARVGVTRRADYHSGWAEFNDQAEVDHSDTISVVRRDGKVVSDHQHSYGHVVPKSVEYLKHLSPDGDVQHGHR